MTQRGFLGDVLNGLFERRGRLRRNVTHRSIQDMCLALLDAEGEVSGIYLAQLILDQYAALTSDEKLEFFTFLNDALEIDVGALRNAVSAYAQTHDLEDYHAIAAKAEPRRQELLRRLNQPPGATRILVEMRTDLLGMLKQNPEFGRLDLDFRHLLRSWFNRGFLVLRQINWETPASILEKIVAYEAVHAIDDWDDLRRRLYPEDRRCFAYFHPTMPDEPLIFVEVALTRTVPSSIQHVLADEREHRVLEDTKVAVFYSISNCQKGLRGISFGNLLIKQVVDELRQELPGLETFVTLSPIPGLSNWLKDQLENEVAMDALAGYASEADVQSLAAQYLITAKTGQGAPLDPVARFHLGNGAQIYAIHGAADTSEKGRQQSCGAMVNYHYDLDLIEQNHERFVQDGEVSLSSSFKPIATRAKRRKPKQRRLTDDKGQPAA